QSKASRAQRRAQRELTVPRGSAREQQVGDIRACDQQDEGDSREEHEQNWPDIADNLLANRRERDAPAGVVNWILLLELARDYVQLRLGLLHCYAGHEPPHASQKSAAGFSIVLRRLERERSPDLHLIVQKMKARWHHADDCVNATADRDLLPEHSIVTAEALLPKLVTEDRNEIRAWPVLIVREPAADQGLDAERREKTGGNDLRLHLDRIAGAGKIQARLPDRRQFIKRAAALLPIEKICRGDHVLMLGMLGEAFPDHDDAIGVGVIERAQEHAIDHAEDRGVRADSKGQRDHGGEGEAGFFEKGTQPVTQILEKSFQAKPGAIRPNFLFHLLYPANFHHGGPARIFFIHPLFHFFLR